MTRHRTASTLPTTWRYMSCRRSDNGGARAAGGKRRWGRMGTQTVVGKKQDARRPLAPPSAPWRAHVPSCGVRRPAASVCPNRPGWPARWCLRICPLALAALLLLTTSAPAKRTLLAPLCEPAPTCCFGRAWLANMARPAPKHMPQRPNHIACLGSKYGRPNGRLECRLWLA